MSMVKRTEAMAEKVGQVMRTALLPSSVKALIGELVALVGDMAKEIDNLKGEKHGNSKT